MSNFQGFIWTKNYIGLLILLVYLIKFLKKYRIISMLKYKLSSTIFFMLQNTIILPYFNYCNIVWGVVVTVI